MVEEGWAAFFPIYPSLPGTDDLNHTIAAAERAWDEQRGAWNEFGPELLLAYAYRLCVKLGTAASADEGLVRAFQRVCFDLRDMSEKGLFGFYEVPPPHRLWAWNDESLPIARLDLGIA